MSKIDITCILLHPTMLHTLFSLHQLVGFATHAQTLRVRVLAKRYSDDVRVSDQYTFLCFHSYPYLLYLIPTLFLSFIHHPYIIILFHFAKCFILLVIIHTLTFDFVLHINFARQNQEDHDSSAVSILQSSWQPSQLLPLGPSCRSEQRRTSHDQYTTPQEKNCTQIKQSTSNRTR